MEKEIDQTLADMRRESELKGLAAKQEQVSAIYWGICYIRGYIYV